MALIANTFFDMRSAIKRAAKTSLRAEAIKKSKALPKQSQRKTKTLKNDSEKPLLSLGSLVQGTVLQRPSKHNKSPYVADVKLDDEGEEVIAHAPMLDLGGLIKPGTVVRLTKSKPGGKTSHAIQLVGFKEIGCDKDQIITWIGAHPSLGNAVAKVLLEGNYISNDVLGNQNKSSITKVQSEVTMRSDTEDTVRSDFVVNEKVVVEVKSCVCADYHKSSAPQIGKKDRYVTVISNEDKFEDYKRAGLFPIGKRAQNFENGKVVSGRCIKHLRHLSRIAQGRDDHGFKESCLLMLVNRGDCSRFRPCQEACPVFADEFSIAKAAGVRIIAAKINWNKDGDCHFRGLLPVHV